MVRMPRHMVIPPRAVNVISSDAHITVGTFYGMYVRTTPPHH